MDRKVEINSIKFCSEAFIAHLLDLLKLEYSTLLSFHRAVRKRDSMTGNKVVTHIVYINLDF